MSCTKNVLGVEFEHHTWRPRVTFAEDRLSNESDMWGRVNVTQHVLCHKQEVCEVCGVTREGTECTCDPDEAARCAPRLDWIAANPKATT